MSGNGCGYFRRIEGVRQLRKFNGLVCRVRPCSVLVTMNALRRYGPYLPPSVPSFIRHSLIYGVRVDRSPGFDIPGFYTTFAASTGTAGKHAQRAHVGIDRMSRPVRGIDVESTRLRWSASKANDTWLRKGDRTRDPRARASKAVACTLERVRRAREPPHGRAPPPPRVDESTRVGRGRWKQGPRP